MIENYSQILAILTTIAGVIGALGYFPQAFKMYRRKSSADISLGAYVIWFVVSVMWVLYAIDILSYPLLITGTVNVIGSTSVMIFYFKYKK